MNAREQAVIDIKEELKRQNKSFIAFKTKLDSIMQELVSNQIKAQILWSQNSK